MLWLSIIRLRMTVEERDGISGDLIFLYSKAERGGFKGMINNLRKCFS